MWPTLYEVQGAYGTLGVHTYGLFALLAFAGGSLLVHLRARDAGLSVERLPLAYLLAALGGFGGAKLLYAITAHDWASLVSAGGGLVWYGGLLGGGLAVIAGARPLGLDPWKLADAAAPGVLLGAMLGRTGCFFAGCCHGAPVVGTDAGSPLLAEGTLHGQLVLHHGFPWIGAVFDGGAARFPGVEVYPTQIWQAVGSAVLLAALLAADRFKRFDGQTFALWLLTEPLLRFVVEMFRGDDRGFVIAWPSSEAPAWLPPTPLADAHDTALVGVTTSQAIAIGMIALGAALLAVRWNRGVAAVERGPEDALGDDLVDGV
jgi:phosphatidylglycerol:prolipoprotein diacylglycerol transferase